MKSEIIVFTGLSGAGKSTLGGMLKDFLAAQGRQATLLDGDSLRTFFDGALAYESKDRLMVSKILVYAATLLAKNGTDVILATMLSQPGARDFLRERSGYVEFFCDAEFEDCASKDIKNLYRENMASENPNIVGHDLHFQHPEAPDLVIKTHKQTPEQSFRQVLDYLISKKLLGLTAE